MGTPLILKIILTDGTCQRLTLSSGPPESIEDLIIEIKRQCCLQGNFRLQFMDSLFGNEFLNLTSVSEIEDKGTIKVINMSRPTSDSIGLDLLQDSQDPSTSFNCHSSFVTDGSIDTGVLSSESTSLRSAWPTVFNVPNFPYDAELKLQQASILYNQNGTVLIPDPKLKSAILDGLVQEILQYKVYVSDKEMDQVAQSLIKKHPCLTERGSSTGYGAWKMSVKYKLSNYRTHLRKLGCPEVTVNSLKNKPAGRCSSAFGIKKAKRAEVNFCPAYPSEETQESLEAMRNALLLETKKRNNRELVKLQMEKTFAYRRHEIVRDAPMVDAFIARWPGLFDIREINAEFKRITTIPLQSKFLSQLDLHFDNLMKMFKRRGGQLGQKLRKIIAQMEDCEDVDAARECVIKGVCVYMGEDPAKLIQEYVGVDEAAIEEAIGATTIGVFHVKDCASTDEDMGVVLEGIRVVSNLDSVPLAVVMLFGLIYALNLAYPADLRYTFEVLQKIVMELDGGKLSNKVLSLKNRL